MDVSPHQGECLRHVGDIARHDQIRPIGPLDDEDRHFELVTEIARQRVAVLKILILIAPQISDPVGVVTELQVVQIENGKYVGFDGRHCNASQHMDRYGQLAHVEA